MDLLKTEKDFMSLTVRDLLEARDAYHVHLSGLENVEATAIGRYRIRKDEPNAKSEKKYAKYGKIETPRTLQNTVVRPWSWPCVLIFVKEWFPISKFHDKPYEAVPRKLYLPDGRVIPTCVVWAPKEEHIKPHPQKLNFPSSLVGGGYPVLTDRQGVEQIGSLGCLASSGDLVFALTNRHVVGEPGQEVYTLIQSVRERIGISDQRQIGKLEFGKAYPGLPGCRAYVNIDAGLVRLDSVYDWTAQIFGIGEVSELVDIRSDNLSLDIIGCPVRAFGGVSGVLEGEIQALFYCYHSIGGINFVADILIGPRPGGNPVRTQPGDSGTIWFLDPPSKEKDRRDRLRQLAEAEAGKLEELSQGQGKPSSKAFMDPREIDGKNRRDNTMQRAETGVKPRNLRPLALQWGGERFVGAPGDRPVQFALGTFLSTVCRELDIKVIRDWNLGHSEYWGKISHFKIGMKACDLLSTPKLRALMLRNRFNIGFDDEVLSLGREFRVGRGQFVPLADIPDYVWIAAAYGTRPDGRRHEGIQHFADMDQKGRDEFSGKTLFDLCKEPRNIKPKVWQKFYESFPEEERPEEGSLPFRIWQLYDAMVDAVRRRDADDFVCIAGILAHYTGDATQPLHLSQYHHGYGPEGGKKSPEWNEYRRKREYKIHSIFEQIMFEVRGAEMIAAVNEALVNVTISDGIVGGHQAAVETVKIMQDCFAILPPGKIIEADEPSETQPERGRILWDAIGPDTAKLVAQGCKLIARLWESAWAEGGGDQIPWERLRTLPEDFVNDKVRDRSFLPALRLEEFAAQVNA